MSLLLNPRLLIALALAGLLAFSHFTAYRKGRNAVQQEWESAVARANSDARRLEQRRQDRADEAAKLAADRDARIRADAVSARRESDGLRDDLSAIKRASAQSLATANNAVRTLGAVVDECTRRYSEVAEEADRATSEVRMLREAWPR